MKEEKEAASGKPESEAQKKQEAALHPSKELMQKIGSIVVHAWELTSPGGQSLDQHDLHGELDQEVRQWVLDLGDLVPKVRTPWPSGEGKA